MAFSADGKTIASATGGDAIRLWDAASGTEKGLLPNRDQDDVLALSFAPNGKALVSSHRSQTIRLWDLAQARVTRQVKFGPAYALAYARDGKTLAVAGAVAIAVFDADSGQQIRQFGSKDGAHLSSVASIAFAPDGKTLATGSFDGIIRLWDSDTGTMLRELEGHQAVVYSLAFSGDGRQLASGSFDKSVRLWETFSGRAINIWKGHNGPIAAVGMTPNGRLVASGSADTTLILWDVTGHTRNGKIVPTQLSQKEMQDAWRVLASEDAAPANQALWNLVAAGPEGMRFLGSQVFLVDPNRIQQLLEDLNNGQFLVRQHASTELGKYGRWIEGVLKEALKQPKSEEVRRRVLKLLDDLHKEGSLSLAQERLRLHRILLALEQEAGTQARKILLDLVRGAPEETFRQDAQATLERLPRSQ
jgi:hypothetical protein